MQQLMEAVGERMVFKGDYLTPADVAVQVFLKSLECVGNVLQENQTEHDVLVLGGINGSTEFGGRAKGSRRQGPTRCR